MDVLNTLLLWDKHLFLWLNTQCHSPFLDSLFVFITTKNNWVIPGSIALLLLVIKQKKRSAGVILLLLIGILISDQISSGVLKPLVGRWRPCKTLEGFRLLVACGGRWSFPSSHAANAAVVATILSWQFPRWRWIWVLVAGLIGFSRIYVGVHYPLDVIAGWILGGLIGIIVVQISMALQRKNPDLKQWMM